MTQDNSTTTPLGRGRTAYLGAVIGIIVSIAYTLGVLMRTLPGTPQALVDMRNRIRGWLVAQGEWIASALGAEPVTREWREGMFVLLTMGAIPLVVMVATGRWRCRDLGIRMPNAIGWRVLIAGYLLALPFVYWMTQSAEFTKSYLAWIERAGLSTLAAYYVVVLLAEHFFFQGAVLAICRADRRWPLPAPVAAIEGGALRKLLRWIGLAQPTDGTVGFARVTRWLGLQDGCVVAVVVSGLLFGAVHYGKDVRELALSFPGGVAMAYLAYRTNTWLVPMTLHLATAATAGAFLLCLS